MKRFGPVAVLSFALATLLAPAFAQTPDTAPLVVRVYYETPEQILELMDYDLFEYNNREERYVLVAVDQEGLDGLLEAGFNAVVDIEETARFNKPRPEPTAGSSGIPGFPCYRTVEETFGFAQKLATSRPNLASWTDHGDTWERTDTGEGRDLRVLRLTNFDIPGPKPTLFLTCSIHAREYTPAELCNRFADRVLNEYGNDADTTWILDHNEIHLMLLANPDGRKKAETGLSWRKNTNTDYCGVLSNDRGADLNRNFEFEWGCCGGSSGSECSLTYRGPAPASEPEVEFIQNYMRDRFADNKGAIPDPAPLDASGVYIDIHSYSELVLWPWGFGGNSPNLPQLRAFGKRLAFFNGYTPQQAIDLYITDGTTIDFAYGELGVAAFVFELGTEFFQECDVFDNEILPDNLPALKYAARVARAPYMDPLGPDSLAVTASPAAGSAGTPVTITAQIDDSRYNQANGAIAVQPIVGAEYFIDTPPWETGAVGFAMNPDDGTFDGTVESVTGIVDTTGLAGGRHTIFVRGENAVGFGPVYATFLDIDFAPVTLSGTVARMGSGDPLAATIFVEELGLETASDPVAGAWSIDVPEGQYTLRAATLNHVDRVLGAVQAGPGSTTGLDFLLPESAPLLLVDDDDDNPEVRSAYTDVLDALGTAYTVWDTAVSGEPDAATLTAYDTAIWFTGADNSANAGPSAAAESILADWLEGSRCLLLSSQDYFSVRGLTPLMSGHLGVDHGMADIGEAFYSGIGQVYGGSGNYFLDPPYPNRTDSVSPGLDIDLAWIGTEGDAGVSFDAGGYRTAFAGFGLEAVTSMAARQSAVSTFLRWCSTLPVVDGDTDGTINESDCAPSDGEVWAVPGQPLDLRIGKLDENEVSWNVPASPGGSAPFYDLVRSADPADFSVAACAVSGTQETVAGDGFTPAAGQAAFYLVRARNACGSSSLGTDSGGVPRTGVSCP